MRRIRRFLSFYIYFVPLSFQRLLLAFQNEIANYFLQNFSMLFIVLVLFAFVDQLSAKPTTDQDAKQVVTGWLSAKELPLESNVRREISIVETFVDANEQAMYHVVYLNTGGFVIVAADDCVEPIIAIVENGTYDPSFENPLGAMVSQDLPKRISSARKLEINIISASSQNAPTDKVKSLQNRALRAKKKWQSMKSYSESENQKQDFDHRNKDDKYTDSSEAQQNSPEASSISDIRVAPLVQSKWNQGSICSGYCYNYYTPHHYLCGCTATAEAQILRYHEYPIAGIGVIPSTIYYDGSAHTAYTRGGDGLGGPYQWDQMPLIPNCGVTELQREAIGALCSDVGIACNMSYTSSGSSASLVNARDAFLDFFQYDNAILQSNYLWNEDMLNTNLDAGYPMMFHISGAGDHAVVCDGYGFDLSTDYHHINMGWGGSSNAWYNLPNIQNFSSVYRVIYNIFPSGTGEIISGRVATFSGDPISGVDITANYYGGQLTTTTNNDGIYSFAQVPSNTTFTISAEKPGMVFSDAQVIATAYSSGAGQIGNVWGIDFQQTNCDPVIALSSNEIVFRVIDDGPEAEPQTLAIWNSASEARLDWQIDYDCNWLNVDPIQNSQTGDITETVLSVNTDHLEAGIYECELLVIEPNASNSPQSVHVMLRYNVSLHVPEIYPTIQSAIDDSIDGETVIVSDGIYVGEGNKDISFGGRQIKVCSRNGPEVTVIDCENNGRGFKFSNNETSGACLEGFTIRNGSREGGGIYCSGCSPVIKNCILENNNNYGSAAIWCANVGYPRIMDCIIRNNSCRWGGGIYCSFSNHATISNCIITNNTAEQGGGIRCNDSSANIENCIIFGNTATTSGGGLHFKNDSSNIRHCIIWDNSPEQITQSDSNVEITYTNVQDSWSGEGNMNTDPYFADPNNGDFHLKSEAGRWKWSALFYPKLDLRKDGFIDLVDYSIFANFWRRTGDDIPADIDDNAVVDYYDLQLLFDNYLNEYAAGEWVFDDVTSPCIDAGHPDAWCTEELWPHGKRVNIGAYGNTPQASMSLSDAGNIANLNWDYFVGHADLQLFTGKWLDREVLLSEDMDRDGSVNFIDYAFFANEWHWMQMGN